MSAVARLRASASAAWEAPRRLAVAPAVQLGAPRAPFVLAVIVLVSIGLVGLILMSTVLQRQAFVIADLDAQITELQNQKQSMTRELEVMESPAGLGQAAIELGMVPNANPVFIQLADGTIIGSPVPAEPRTNIRRVTP